MAAGRADAGVPLAELVTVLSLGTDLGLGQPMEHMLRQCLIALGLAERMGLDDEQRGVVYYTALLAWVGCHVDAHEQARWLGDDLELKGDVRLVDLDNARSELAFMLRHLWAGKTPLERIRLGFSFAADGYKAVEAMFENHWIATEGLVRTLDLGDGVLAALPDTFERWDGRGMRRVRGDEISVAGRLVTLADVVEIVERTGGVEPAVTVARERSGTQFDPAIVELFAAQADDVFGEISRDGSWEHVIAADPSPGRAVPDRHLDDVLGAVADFTDLKCPFLIGHSASVADHAADAAALMGLPGDESRLVRRAGSSTTSDGSVFPTRSGTSARCSPAPSGSGSASTRTSRSGCSQRRPRWRRSGLWRRSTTSASTAPDTRVGWRATRCRPGSRARRGGRLRRAAAGPPAPAEPIGG